MVKERRKPSDRCRPEFLPTINGTEGEFGVEVRWVKWLGAGEERKKLMGQTEME